MEEAEDMHTLIDSLPIESGFSSSPQVQQREVGVVSWRLLLLIFIASSLIYMFPLGVVLSPFKNIQIIASMPVIFEAAVSGLLTVLLIYLFGGI